jgi:hypothetical protein
MLKLVALLLFSLLSLSAAALYEDVPEVMRLSRSGDYEIINSSRYCAVQGAVNGEMDLLIGKEGTLCIDSIVLPKSVKEEIALMEASELENESDYDQRITSFLAFRWSGLKEEGLTPKTLTTLAKSLNINLEEMQDGQISDFRGDENSFNEFTELFHGLEYVEGSKTQDFLIRSFLRKSVQSVQFHQEVPLYPGGGFNVTHYFFYSPSTTEEGSQGQVVYVKLSWWNS